MTPKQIAKNIITEHFTVGSLTWCEALETALITTKHMNSPDIHNEVKLIQQQTVLNGNIYQNKTEHIIAEQLKMMF